MAEAQNLKRFHIEPEGEGFVLRIEDEAGETFSVLATHDQLDLIADDIEDQLDADEESELVEDEDEEDEKN